MLLGDGTAAESSQQSHQIVDLFLQRTADVPVFPDGVGPAGKGLVGHQAQAVGVVDERIAGDAGGALVGLAEAAVDHQQLAAALDGALALFGLDGHMAVDDVAVLALQAKLPQQLFTDVGVFVEAVVGVFGLGPGVLVGDEAALEGGHAVAAEDGAVASAPQPPQKVHAELPLGRAGLIVVGAAGRSVGVVQKLLTAEVIAADGEAQQLTILAHGHAAVEQQSVVVDLVEASLGIEEADVALQLLAVAEGAGQRGDERLLLRREGVGILGVHGGEVGIQHGIGLAVNGDALVLVVDFVQQQPVLHAEAGVAQDLLPLQLEQDHGDGLVHLGHQTLVSFSVVFFVVAGELDLEPGDVASLVYRVGKHTQRAQGDAVAGFDNIQIVVAQGVEQHRGYQCAGAGGSAHPQNVVVAPLDIHVVIVQQGVHDDVGAGAAVIDITHQMQVIHRQTLDQLAQLDQEVGGAADIDDGGDDVLVIIALVCILVVGVDQLVDDVGIFRRHGFAHLGARVLGADQTAHFNEPVEGDAVPLPHILGDALNLLQLLLRIVDQRGQLVALAAGHGGAEQILHLFAHHAGGGDENMLECLVLAVHVGDKVLRALGQVQNGLQVDDLGAGGLHVGELLGQHLQIMQMFRTIGDGVRHGCHPPCVQNAPYFAASAAFGWS